MGLPLGVQVVARHWDDSLVLAEMTELEDHFSAGDEYPRLDDPGAFDPPV